MRFVVLMVVHTKNVIFCDSMPCRLEEFSNIFGEIPRKCQ
jgi:hypothetical protein